MNINVNAKVRWCFWNEPPPDTQEFWAFQWPPPCKVGDPLYFRFDGTIVAEAIVDRIEKPGESQCEHSGKFGNQFKVFWTQESFKDLRTPEMQQVLDTRKPRTEMLAHGFDKMRKALDEE